MSEMIDGIEVRNRGGVIEHRHEGREYWHAVTDKSVIDEMNKRHDDNIRKTYPVLYKS